MRLRTVETNYSLPRMSSTRSVVSTLLMRFKYHLLRNVLPVLFMLLTLGWLTLALAEQIQQAKETQLFALEQK